MSYTKEEILSKMSDVMTELFELDAGQIVEGARLYEDLDIDSIDAVDLMIELRPFIGQKFSPEDFKEVRTVGDIVATIQKLVG